MLIIKLKKTIFRVFPKFYRGSTVTDKEMFVNETNSQKKSINETDNNSRNHSPEQLSIEQLTTITTEMETENDQVRNFFYFKKIWFSAMRKENAKAGGKIQ